MSHKYKTNPVILPWLLMGAGALYFTVLRPLMKTAKAGKEIIEEEAARAAEGIDNNISPTISNKSFAITMKMPIASPTATEFPFTIKNVGVPKTFYYRVEARPVGKTGLSYAENEGPYTFTTNQSMDTYTKWGTIVGTGFVKGIAQRYRATTYYEYRVLVSLNPKFPEALIFIKTPWYKFHGF